MTTDNERRVDEIRARLTKRTPGPWETECSEVGGNPPRCEEWTAFDANGHPFYSAYREVDAEFIAHTPDDITFLLSELDELRTTLDAVRDRETKAWADLLAERDALREELDEARRNIALPIIDGLNDLNAALREELRISQEREERLREALERIASGDWNGEPASSIARAALHSSLPECGPLAECATRSKHLHSTRCNGYSRCCRHRASLPERNE